MPFTDGMDDVNNGRGVIATADMKARIAALRQAGTVGDDLISVLWDRNRRAVMDGQGFRYEFAPPQPRAGADQV